MIRVAVATATILLASTLTTASKPLQACGGFFCQTTPINQAGEQIVFRQEGNEITAMVRILYSGSAEEFSWVVPVPNTPEISLGSDITFTQLEFATRPQFFLERRGEQCEEFVPNFGVTPDTAGAPGNDEDDSGVFIEQEMQIGPFDIDIVSSDNPDDLAIWLQDNGYELTDRGAELLAPYITDGMKFVAVKLLNGEDTGSIQPLLMKYTSDNPVIPIRLTAVAAMPDMGVLAWIVADARAVPENYEHVTPNYTRLNWYTGSGNAYASYQTLITDAMNETAEGQGFATDFAGGISDELVSQLSTTDAFESFLADLDGLSDAEYISRVLFEFIFSGGSFDARLAVLQRELPLQDGSDNFIYQDPAALQFLYSPEQLQAARIALQDVIVTREIEPIRNATALLPQGAYMTRLFTTLSAEEMTRDPIFSYNASMPDQPIERNALLESSCGENGTEWTLTLGEGTDREGEVVVAANQPVPVSAAPAGVDTQPAAILRERTSDDAAPELLFMAEPGVLEIAADGSVSNTGIIISDDDDGFLGSSGPVLLLLASGFLALRRHIKLKATPL